MVAVVAAAACGGGDDASQPNEPFTTTTEQGAPSTTTTTAPSTTTTAVNVDPLVIPSEVTVEYAQAVMDGLVHLEGEILRLAVALGDIEEIRALQRAIYHGDYLDLRGRILLDAAASGFEGAAPVPGDRIIRVVEVAVSTPECVAVVAESDFGPVGPGALEGGPSTVELRIAEADPADGVNPTPYAIASELRGNPDDLEVAPCA